ncbi:MAG: hypothetical protein K6F53_09165 [Lachnospiraceae bacterium]|nr:hypothetical protein [Lachnospiraceae bacterium]
MAVNEEEKRNYTVEAPLSEQKSNDGAGRKKWFMIAIIAVAAILLIGLVAYFATRGNPRAQVASAFKKTFENYAKGDNKLFTTCNIGDIIKDRDYTILVSGSTQIPDTGEIAMDLEAAVATDLLQLNGNVDTGNLPPIGFQAQLSNEDLRFFSPMFNDYQFLYKYRVDNSQTEFGQLLDQLGMENLDTKTINDTTASVYSFFFDSSASGFMNDIVEAVKDQIASIPVDRADKRKLTIDGKERNCKAYRMNIRHDDVVAVADRMDEVLDKYYGDALDLDVAGSTAEDMIVNIRNYANQFDHITLTFYIWKKELAAINMDGGASSMEVQFKGGDYRAQNLSLLTDGEEYCTVEGRITDNEETMLLVTSDETYLSTNYKLDSGDLELNIGNASETNSFKATVTNDGNRLNVRLNDLDTGSGYVAGLISVKKGTELKTIDGNEFNLTTADSDALTGMVLSIYQTIVGLNQ